MDTKNIIIITAEEGETKLARKFLPEFQVIEAGVGAGNIIKFCHNLPDDAMVANIGYAGSNLLDIGTVCRVSESRRHIPGVKLYFTDHNNPYAMSSKGYPCYTANSFVTSSELTDPALFDMELNYIAAFPYRTVGAIKIVSDNLSVDVFRNNAIRESGILSSDEVWSKVREEFLKMVEDL